MKTQPQIGEFVSYTFNGDTYPDSKVKKITPTGIVVTESGKRYRPDSNGNHKMENSCWYLVLGNHYSQNPSF